MRAITFFIQEISNAIGGIIQQAVGGIVKLRVNHRGRRFNHRGHYLHAHDDDITAPGPDILRPVFRRLMWFLCPTLHRRYPYHVDIQRRRPPFDFFLQFYPFRLWHSKSLLNHMKYSIVRSAVSLLRVSNSNTASRSATFPKA